LNFPISMCQIILRITSLFEKAGSSKELAG